MSAFNTLLAELCAGIDAAEALAIIESRCMTVDDVAMTLHPAGDADPDGLHVYCELGELPAEPQASTALRRLLEFNLHLFRQGAPSFGLEALGGHPVLMTRMDVSTLTTPDLRRRLADLASVAHAWQATRFADGALAMVAA